MSEVLVRANGLGKAYPKAFRNRDRLRALWRLLFSQRATDSLAVLADVDLEVRRGESLGLIGANGAGKSTLLKLITGVLTPTTGSVSVHGEIGALLELGAGFHLEHTGRDNITMTAALHGLGGAALRERLPQIIEFADIGRYIDEPVKHYSSGMVVRLGFAIVAVLRPDLLITDEVLAVGDEAFQKKCIKWMQDYLDGGGTLILVSHSMYHVQKLCQRACWLRDGRVEMIGDVFDVTQAYLAFQERKSGDAGGAAAARDHDVEFSLGEASINGHDAETPLLLDDGEPLIVRARVRSREGRVPVLMVGIVRVDGTPVYGVASDMDGYQPQRIGAHEFACELVFDALHLLPGTYLVRIHPLDPEGIRLFDTWERGVTVRGASRELGMVRLPHRWRDQDEVVR
ncbi:MAG: ABC transporter ATP-binding protein [Dokdonella sp.]|uniref:ABC transporter ATP-binding protein n=1 Tax=Dokdonella sp. TaxID=2291710 RepID=UPI0025B9B994|nr:ABC transporter ATP-binding protein [Dokdonella sp.]MBX3701135.1 ABC transporter ATP-binding protein [Dokdonella sp.]MCW5579096.1 ABC transporter ATP-binding protein [Dokdonella sp.]